MVESEQNRGGVGKVILIIVGIVALLAVGLVLVSNILRNARERVYAPHCTESLKTIARACDVYADENQGHFPTDLRILLEAGRLTEDALKCSAISKKDRDYGSPPYVDYDYFGNGLVRSELDNPDRTILAGEPAPVHPDGTMAILFASGRIEMVSSESIQAIVKKRGLILPSALDARHSMP